jgi:hypothetical protein
LEAFEQAGEGVSLGWREVGEQAGEPFAECCLSRAQRPLPVLGQGERLAAAVVLEPLSGQQSGFFESREELRDGGRGDGGAAGELGADDLALADRLQREILGDGERRLVRGEQALDPAADQRRRADERLRRLAAVVMMTRARH